MKKSNMSWYAYFYEELDPDCETVIKTLSNEGKESFGGWHPATPTVVSFHPIFCVPIFLEDLSWVRG